ncbi:hypothetical protein [Hymenobacter arizonensis]|uniref:hypothetical protein n=1 Tax=Hymenobacter arizonensis TaxID=1227077 RepID=UPI0011603047|nr:hypothetical protein [Hymenobacter arizonensis]
MRTRYFPTTSRSTDAALVSATCGTGTGTAPAPTTHSTDTTPASSALALLPRAARHQFWHLALCAGRF